MLLNKFPVLPAHVLLVTRGFEEQTSPLTFSDFQALCWGLAQGPALGFYNSGALAGASQRHKHLQLVALPLSEQEPELPLESPTRARGAELGPRQRATSFPARLRRIASGWWTDAEAPAQLLGLLAELHRRVGQPAAHNLLLTRRFMVAVPRIAERFGTISVNALGFAGALLVKDAGQKRELLAAGPMAALVAAAGAP